MRNWKKYATQVVLILALAIMLGSCGIFKKGCDCPKFGKVNAKGQNVRTV